MMVLPVNLHPPLANMCHSSSDLLSFHWPFELCCHYAKNIAWQASGPLMHWDGPCGNQATPMKV